MEGIGFKVKHEWICVSFQVSTFSLIVFINFFAIFFWGGEGGGSIFTNIFLGTFHFFTNTWEVHKLWGELPKSPTPKQRRRESKQP